MRETRGFRDKLETWRAVVVLPNELTARNSLRRDRQL